MEVRARLVVISNRLPVAAVRAKNGVWSLRPGSGGLVTALAPVLENRGGLWVGWPGSIGEKNDEIRPLLESFAQYQGYALVPVSLTQSEHDLFYLGFANEVLWPLFHDLQSRCTFVPEYWQAFLDVNRKFAIASEAAAQPRPRRASGSISRASRSEIPEYIQQKAEVERLVGEINGELGQPGWVPIHYFSRSVDREELVAGDRSARYGRRRRPRPAGDGRPANRRQQP